MDKKRSKQKTKQTEEQNRTAGKKHKKKQNFKTLSLHCGIQGLILKKGGTRNGK